MSNPLPRNNSNSSNNRVLPTNFGATHTNLNQTNKPTNFGARAVAGAKPIASNQNLQTELARRNDSVGAYGQYGATATNQDLKKPLQQNPATKPNTGALANSTSNFGQIRQNTNNPNQRPPQQIPQPNSQNNFFRPSPQSNSQQQTQQQFRPNLNQRPQQQTINQQSTFPVGKQVTNNQQITNSQPNRPNPRGAIKPKVDTNSLEYLRSLNPTELKREIIKTEIDIQKTLIASEKSYRQGTTNIRDLIAPSGVSIGNREIQINTKLVRSHFVLVYPRVVTMGWLEGIVNSDIQLDLSIFIYPRDSSEVLRELRGKVGKIQASLNLNQEQGKARDPQLETAYRDVEGLRDAIQQGVEKFYRVGIYIQVYGNTQEELEKSSQTVEGILSQQNILIKRSALQMDDGFNACLPILKDDLDVVTNMNTSPLSAAFPFVSSDLSSDSGILYGVNIHNSSLVIFDRFELENANSLVFATSGAGKSYTVKLEILRSRMLGVGVIVIDPEQEYKILADALGGVYINLSLNASSRINPFDLPKPLPGESVADILRTAIIDLMGLFNLMLGKLNPTEVSVMEKAVQQAYAKRDITDSSDLGTITPPTMGDLVEILNGIVGGESLAQRLYRYTEGTFSGMFNRPTNINISNDFIVFSIRDLQETLRPIAMYILLKYVWTEIRSKLKRRILVVDEAWIMMQYEDSARFLYGLAKRARKYYLGITTISQDVTDFLSSPLGKPIITNSAMKILLKQSPAAIDQLVETFSLTNRERQLLLEANVGQGIFFAGSRHVGIEIIPFPREHEIITTNPKDLMKKELEEDSK